MANPQALLQGDSQSIHPYSHLTPSLKVSQHSRVVCLDDVVLPGHTGLTPLANVQVVHPDHGSSATVVGYCGLCEL